MAVVLAAAALLATGCGRSSNNTAAPNTTTTSPTSVLPSTSEPATTSTPPATTTTAPPIPAGRSAADRLADFFAGAERVDRQLRATAKLVNTAFSAKTMTFTVAMQNAIKAVDPQTVVPAIPAGLDSRLQNRVYLVFSELVSRRYAFRPIMEAEPGHPIARDSDDGRHVLLGLSHGVGPAARFAADLAATRQLARSVPPGQTPAPDSRASAEVAVRITSILSRNYGCGTSGGWIQSSPAPFGWTSGDGWHLEGRINGIVFEADYQPSQGWSVNIHAC